jgi:hypothetical protein
LYLVKSDAEETVAADTTVVAVDSVAVVDTRLVLLLLKHLLCFTIKNQNHPHPQMVFLISYLQKGL